MKSETSFGKQDQGQRRHSLQAGTSQHGAADTFPSAAKQTDEGHHDRHPETQERWQDQRKKDQTTDNSNDKKQERYQDKARERQTLRQIQRQIDGQTKRQHDGKPNDRQATKSERQNGATTERQTERRRTWQTRPNMAEHGRTCATVAAHDRATLDEHDMHDSTTTTFLCRVHAQR